MTEWYHMRGWREGGRGGKGREGGGNDDHWK